jgi:hypothetical protein
MQLQLWQMASGKGSSQQAVSGTKELYLMTERVRETLADACHSAPASLTTLSSDKQSAPNATISTKFPQDAQVRFVLVTRGCQVTDVRFAFCQTAVLDRAEN